MYILSMTFDTAPNGIVAFPILEVVEAASKAFFRSASRNRWRVGCPSSDAWNVFLGPKKDMAGGLLRFLSFEAHKILAFKTRLTQLESHHTLRLLGSHSSNDKEREETQAI